MPRAPQEIVERFSKKSVFDEIYHLLDCATKEHEPSAETMQENGDELRQLIVNLPDIYSDVQGTLSRYKISESHKIKGILDSFLRDFKIDFEALPKNSCLSDNTQEESIKSIIGALGLGVSETFTFAARNPSLEDIPQGLHHHIKEMLLEMFPKGIYRHQAAGINAFLEGNDVCLATSTASGKSMVFSAIAADLLVREPGPLVIAMYPARALVQDQLLKWKELGRALNLKIGQIDGSVNMGERYQILNESHIVVMTPDVVHAWLMREVAETRSALQRLKLLILDEAHVYTGIFGTNMAYLLRRIQAVSGPHRLIAATATIGAPEEFLEKLTGRDSFKLIGEEQNGAPTGPKTVHLVNLRAKAEDRRVMLQTLLKIIATSYPGKFIAFSDSRMGVEQAAGDLMQYGIMPYRSGYEDPCRKEIQNSLNSGKLKGVVSTSALEIGVDIRDIDLVVILNYPPTINSFRQRLGRAGRSNQGGECLIVDTQGLITASDGGLEAYLGKPPEVAHLYLGNKSLEFGNVLCAHDELSKLGLAKDVLKAGWTAEKFPGLPESFSKLLANEQDRTFALPDELEDIRQEVGLADAAPQLQIPLRGICGKDFNLRVQPGNNPGELDPGSLGYLTLGQRFREAYPGAIHRHLGVRYRVIRTQRGPNGREVVLKALQGPARDTSINPRKSIFPIYSEKRILKRSDEGFIVATKVEIDERINGFKENGRVHDYNQDSRYFKKPFGHRQRSCGVIWFLGEDCADSEILPFLTDAFCSIAGISSREIGYGKLTQDVCPLFHECGSAFVIYDDTPGNFYLTDDLIRYWPEVLKRAKIIAEASASTNLERLSEIFDNLYSRSLDWIDVSQTEIEKPISDNQVSDENDWFLVIAPGEKVFRKSDIDFVEHTVAEPVMRRDGLYYKLEATGETYKEESIVPASVVIKMAWFNMKQLRDYHIGPDYFTIKDLKFYTPPQEFLFKHNGDHNMRTCSAICDGRQYVLRDPRVPGGIAFGTVQQLGEDWIRMFDQEQSIVCSVEGNIHKDSFEWIAERICE